MEGSGGFGGVARCDLLVGLGGLWQAVLEGLRGRAAVHAAALVRSLVIVDHQVVVEHALHLLDGFEPGAPALDPKVLVEQRAVQALDDSWFGITPSFTHLAVMIAYTVVVGFVAIRAFRWE